MVGAAVGKQGRDTARRLDYWQLWGGNLGDTAPFRMDPREKAALRVGAFHA